MERERMTVCEIVFLRVSGSFNGYMDGINVYYFSYPLVLMYRVALRYNTKMERRIKVYIVQSKVRVFL